MRNMCRGIGPAVICGLASGTQAQDAGRGERVPKSQCSIFHSPQPGRNIVGPSLFSVVGRHPGMIPGFHYSAANRASGLVWDRSTLDRYLTAGEQRPHRAGPIQLGLRLDLSIRILGPGAHARCPAFARGRSDRQNSTGATVYAWYDRSLYLEAGVYNTYGPTLLTVSGSSLGPGATAGPAPYARAAYEWNWNGQSAHVGALLLHSDLNPASGERSVDAAFGQDS